VSPIGLKATTKGGRQNRIRAWEKKKEQKKKTNRKAGGGRRKTEGT
jgi:hypothetical protein